MASSKRPLAAKRSSQSAISFLTAPAHLSLQMQKPHHHIRHLHAGVVDVVLHHHLLPRRPQQPHKRVAQNRIAQMPDMRRLVGIDAGVLHRVP